MTSLFHAPSVPQPRPKLVIIRKKPTDETALSLVGDVPVVVVLDCDKRAGFIYEIYNDVNDMVYVGSTINMEQRFSRHKSASSTRDSKFYTAVREIGFENFHMRCLEEFRYTEDDELVKREFEHMAEYGKEMLYNTDTEYGLRSDETRDKISASHLGKTHTDEIKAKISASNLGKTRTDEAKAKMSASQLGKKKTDETKAKMSTSQLGKKKTDKTKAKISASSLGKKMTDEARVNMSKARQTGGCIRVKGNSLMYRYTKDGRQTSKSFSFGALSIINQEQAMVLALEYQRETFPDLFDIDEDSE